MLPVLFPFLPFRHTSGSKLLQNFGLLDAVNSCDRIENGIQCSEPQSIVLWNGYAVISRLFGLEKDVAAFLIKLGDSRRSHLINGGSFLGDLNLAFPLNLFLSTSGKT
jgi:hypothetical protein